MTTNIYLRKGKSKVSVYIRYRHKQHERLFPTGIKLDLDKWDTKSNCVNFAKGIRADAQNESLLRQLKKQSTSANTQIKKVESEIVHFAQMLLQEDKEPLPSSIAYRLKLLKSDSVEQKEVPVEQLLENYIDRKKSVISNASIKQHKSSLATFKEFLKSKKILLKKLSNIDFDFFSQYEFWLSDTKKYGKNTVWSKIKWLKSAINDYQKRGYEVYNPSNYKLRPERPEKIIYLYDNEMELLEKHDFGSAHSFRRVADVFLFVCNTGFRYSDVKRLNKTHITNDVIQLRAFKNQKDTIVPLNKKAAGILQKYDYELPVISEQKYNDYIKEAFARAGLDRRIEKTVNKQGKKSISQIPLNELASSHMAVRTFITRCLHRGISVIDVARIVGKTSKVLIDHYSGHLDNERLVSAMKNAFDD